MNNKWIALVTTPLLACSSGAIQTEKEMPFIGNSQVVRYKLDNGLKLLVVEDHSSPTFAYQTWFDVGSRHEKTDFTGLAHLFEHMMFKGTTKYPGDAFERVTDAIGAEGQNAFTNQDNTVYVIEVPKENLDLMADLEADRMVNLVVDDNAFKTEREVVQNERRLRTENSPDGTAFQQVFDLAYNSHPYHWPVIGYQEDLNRMSAADAREFYKKHYSPDNATVVVVGDVDADHVLSVVKKHYGSLPKSTVDREESSTPEPEQTAPRRKRLELNVEVEKVMTAYHMPAVGHPDLAALKLLDAVLSGGKSSRLRRALVDTGIMTSAWSYMMDLRHPGLFMLGGNLQKGKRTALAESAFLREIEKLVKEPVSAAELERAKNRMSFDLFDGLGSNKDKAHFLGEAESRLGDFRKGLEEIEQIRRLDAASVQMAAQKYLKPNGRTIVTVIPKAKGAKK